MNELLAQASTIARGMWRRRWIGLVAAWVAIAVGAVFLLRMPDRYEAKGRVYVDTKTVLKPLMRDLAVEPDIGQTIQMLARILITRPNVETLMRRLRLDAGAVSQEDRDRIVDSLTREIKIEGGRDNVFTFIYRDKDPARAKLVVESLVSLFVESDTGAQRRDAMAARDFIDEQIRSYVVRLTEAENRLKDFKLRNLEVTDAAGQDYISRIRTLTEELDKLTLELRVKEQSREALRRELSGEEPILLPETPVNTVGSSPELDARLEAQRKQLDELLRRYTDLHPDVIATRRLIARLEEQKELEAEAKRRAAGNQPTRLTASTNPVFQQIKLALADAEANVAALRTRVGETQSRLSQLRASASRIPQVEAELAQLNRDYDVIRRNYEVLVGRREKASMSEEVDASARLAQFRVIEPPRASERPVFPSRAGVAPLVLLLSIGVGLGASFVASQLVPTFSSAAMLQRVTGRPVLGSVAKLTNNPDAMWRARKSALGFGAAFGGLILTSGALIAWLSLATRP